MYKNYGDVNFLEYGLLIEEQSENQFNFIVCRPFSDCENKYQYFDGYIDISDSWIDKESVMNYIGMEENKFDRIQFAIGCIEYYNLENFGTVNNDYTKEEVIENIKYIKDYIADYDDMYFE